MQHRKKGLQPNWLLKLVKQAHPFTAQHGTVWQDTAVSLPPNKIAYCRINIQT